MKHLLQHTSALSCKILLVGGLITLFASCASEVDDVTETASTEVSSDDDVLPKEELKLAINSADVNVTEKTRSTGYSSQDGTLDKSTSLGLFVIHEKRYEDPKGYKQLRDFDKYTYGMDGDYYNYQNDGYDNLKLTYSLSNGKYNLEYPQPIYYPWGKKLASDDQGRVALAVYAPYDSTLTLSKLESSRYYFMFPVKTDQRSDAKVLANDLLIGIIGTDDRTKFRLPGGQTADMTLKHVLSKVTLKVDIKAVKDSTLCDSIKVYVENISTKAIVNPFTFDGNTENVHIINRNTETDFDPDDIVMTDTLADLIPCTSNVFSPKSKILMCKVDGITSSMATSGQTKSFYTTAIVVPGYVPDLQFSIRLYGAKRNAKGDARKFSYDEYGHLYAEYTPKPADSSNLTILKSGYSYTFKFVNEKTVEEDSCIDIDIQGDGSDNKPWVLGSKQGDSFNE